MNEENNRREPVFIPCGDSFEKMNVDFLSKEGETAAPEPAEPEEKA